MVDLKSGEQKHPADEIALALLRAGGILSSLTNCYDAEGGEFAIDASFLAEAIRSAEQIIFKANDSLTSLYEDYSLELVSQVEEYLPPQSLNSANSEQTEKLKTAQAMSHAADGSRFARKIETLVEDDASSDMQEQSDDTAQSYDEFFEKLTGT